MRGSAWMVCLLVGLGCSRANPLYGDDEAVTTGTPEATTTAVDTGRTDTSGGGTRGMGGTDDGSSTTSSADTVSLDGPITSTEGPLDTGLAETGVLETGGSETGVAETGNVPEPCCSPHLGPGCGTAEIDEACVCLNHPSCCNDGWHLGCVAAAVVECGLVCEPLAINACCDASLTPGCADWEAMLCTCDIDPLCCIGPWTETCVSQYAEGCGAPCAAP